MVISVLQNLFLTAGLRSWYSGGESRSIISTVYLDREIHYRLLLPFCYLSGLWYGWAQLTKMMENRTANNNPHFFISWMGWDGMRWDETWSRTDTKVRRVFNLYLEINCSNANYFSFNRFTEWMWVMRFSTHLEIWFHNIIFYGTRFSY